MKKEREKTNSDCYTRKIYWYTHPSSVSTNIICRIYISNLSQGLPFYKYRSLFSSSRYIYSCLTSLKWPNLYNEPSTLSPREVVERFDFIWGGKLSLNVMQHLFSLKLHFLACEMQRIWECHTLSPKMLIKKNNAHRVVDVKLNNNSGGSYPL